MASSTESPSRPSDSLANQVRNAVIWRSGSQILAQLVQWASTFLVIRLLDPHDYGLFAMTGVVLVFLNMLNGYGLASGLIQQRVVTPLAIRQLFGMLLLLNAGLATLQCLILAPAAAAYYRQPVVADMLRVQALLYLTTPFIALPYALLSRAMDFRMQARANIVASVAAAGAALAGALAGLGVWTLVLAPIVLFTVRAIGMTIAARSLVWPSFDFRGAGTLARYGGVMAIGQLFWFAQSQADVFIAGRNFTPYSLGLYTEALFLTQIFVSKIVPPLNEVAFSAYARIQHDRAAVAVAFTRSVRIIMLAALPFYFGLAVVAEPLVVTVMGDKMARNRAGRAPACARHAVHDAAGAVATRVRCLRASGDRGAQRCLWRVDARDRVPGRGALWAHRARGRVDLCLSGVSGIQPVAIAAGDRRIASGGRAGDRTGAGRGDRDGAGRDADRLAAARDGAFRKSDEPGGEWLGAIRRVARSVCARGVA